MKGDKEPKTVRDKGTDYGDGYASNSSASGNSGNGGSTGAGYGYHLRHGSLALSYGDLTSWGVRVAAGGTDGYPAPACADLGAVGSGSRDMGTPASTGCDSTDSHDGVGYPRSTGHWVPPNGYGNGHSHGHAPSGVRGSGSGGGGGSQRYVTPGKIVPSHRGH